MIESSLMLKIAKALYETSIDVLKITAPHSEPADAIVAMEIASAMTLVALKGHESTDEEIVAAFTKHVGDWMPTLRNMMR